MLYADDLAAKAARCEELASQVIEPLLAASLRRRAGEWRDMAAEVNLVQRDPIYRLIHDRPDQ